MRGHHGIGFALVVGMSGGACGQGADVAGSIPIEPEITVGSQTLHQTRIRALDASGGAHEGVAVSSQPFQPGFDRYAENLQAILSSDGGGARQSIPFEARLDRARVAMSDALAAGDVNVKLALLFEEDDVIGYQGSAGSSEAVADTANDRGSSHRVFLTTGFFYDPVMTVVGPHFGYTPQHWCYAAYALGNRTTDSTGGDAFMSFWGPAYPYATVYMPFQPQRIAINASSPWYNWGNWQGFAWGYYQVVMENVSGKTTISPVLGCML